MAAVARASHMCARCAMHTELPLPPPTHAHPPLCCSHARSAAHVGWTLPPWQQRLCNPQLSRKALQRPPLLVGSPVTLLCVCVLVCTLAAVNTATTTTTKTCARGEYEAYPDSRQDQGDVCRHNGAFKGGPWSCPSSCARTSAGATGRARCLCPQSTGAVHMQRPLLCIHEAGGCWCGQLTGSKNARQDGG